MNQHSHYFKDVSHLRHIDVYRVLDLFGVKDHAVGHAIKKLLCAGQRGGKDYEKDLREAVDSVSRALQMIAESDVPDYATGGLIPQDFVAEPTDPELMRRLLQAASEYVPQGSSASCCEACWKEAGGKFIHRDRMMTCSICRNKRCPRASDHRMACTGSNEPAEERVIPKAENDALLAALRDFDLDARASDIRLFAMVEIDSVLCKVKTPLEAANSIAAATRKMLENRP